MGASKVRSLVTVVSISWLWQHATCENLDSVRIRTGGNGTPIVFGATAALDCCSKYSDFGRYLRQTWELYVGWVGQVGGLKIGDQRRPLEVRIYNDYSEPEATRNGLDAHLKDGVRLLLSTFGSDLSEESAKVAHNSAAVLMCSTAASRNIVRGRPTVFNTMGPEHKYFESAFVQLAKHPAKSVGYFAEADMGATAVCSHIPTLARTHSLQLKHAERISGTAERLAVRDLVLKFKEDTPDVIVGCVREKVCHLFIEEMVENGLNPSSVILTVCVTLPSFRYLGYKGRWILGVTPWLQTSPLISEVTGLSASEFHARYLKQFNEAPPYQAASAWAAAVALGEAVQRAGSVEPQAVTEQLRAMSLQTVFGLVSFDSHGQNDAAFGVVQVIDESEHPRIIAPAAEAEVALVYPMRNSAETCEEGEVLDAGSSDCRQCEPGQRAVESRACVMCTAGQFGASAGQVACEACGAGNYTPTSGSTACSRCPSGSYNWDIQQSECLSCREGFFSDSEGSTKCTPCPIGEYSDKMGSHICQKCSPGRVTLGMGSESNKSCVCPEGTYFEDDSCQSCPLLRTTRHPGKTSASSCIYSETAKVLAGITSGVVVAVPASIMLLWMFMRRRIRIAMELRERALKEKIAQGLATIEEFAHPMAVMRGDRFADLSYHDLQSLHEGARDRGQLTFFDTIASIKSLKAARMRSRIILFSYEWLSWSAKGPNTIQFDSMNEALNAFCSQEELEKSEVYVWLDILSIPQCHQGVQVLAINSLYTYASVVDALVIVAPDSMHEDTGEKADLESYRRRTWTRMEQLAHVAAHDMESMYVARPGGLRVTTKEWLIGIVHLFDGNMTCCRLGHAGTNTCDKEKLVLPLLGLWYSLRGGRGKRTNTGAKMLLSIIHKDVQKVFPPKFAFECDQGTKEKNLFGDLITRLEDMLRRQHVLVEASSSSVESRLRLTRSLFRDRGSGSSSRSRDGCLKQSSSTIESLSASERAEKELGLQHGFRRYVSASSSRSAGPVPQGEVLHDDPTPDTTLVPSPPLFGSFASKQHLQHL